MQLSKSSRFWCVLVLALHELGTLSSAQPIKFLSSEQKQQLEEATNLNQRAKTLYRGGKSREAIALVERELSIRRSVLGDEHPDTAGCLQNLGNLNEAARDYLAARKNYELALKINRKIFGEEHDSTASNLDHLGGMFYDQGDYAAARPFLEQALKIRRKVLGEEHPTTAFNSLKVGLVLAKQRDFAAAQSYLDQALRIQRKTLGDEHPDTVQTIEGLSYLLGEKGDLVAARTNLEQVLKIKRKVLGEEHLETARTLRELGELAHDGSDLAAGKAYFERALKIQKKILGDEHPEVAYTMDSFGYLLINTGEYADAAMNLEQALKIREKTLGSESADTSKSLYRLGVLLRSRGDYTQAKRRFEQALRIRRKVFGDENPLTADCINVLGGIHLTQGDRAGARQYYQEAFQSYQKSLGDDNLKTAMCRCDLAGLQDDYIVIRQSTEKALKILKSHLGEEHIITAEFLGRMGNLLHRIGDVSAAHTYLERALRIHRKILGDEHGDTAMTFANLGNVLRSQGDGRGSRQYLEQALKIQKKVFGLNHITTAETLIGLSHLMSDERNYVAARGYGEESLVILRKVLGNDHPDTARLLHSLGFLSFAMKDTDAARSYFNQTHSIYQKFKDGFEDDIARLNSDLAGVEALAGNWEVAGNLTDQSRRMVRQYVARLLPALSEREQVNFLHMRDEVYLHQALTLGLIQREDSKLTELSAGWLLNGKGVAQSALAERVLLTKDVKNPQLNKIVNELVEVRQKLSGLALTNSQPGKEAERRQNIEQLTEQEDRLTRNLTEARGKVARKDPWVDVAEVRKALPSDGVLIDIVRFRSLDYLSTGQSLDFLPPHYVAWVIPPTGDVQIVDLGLADAIDAAVANAKRMVASATTKDGLLQKQGEPAAQQQLQQELQHVTDLVWKPIENKLGNSKQLKLSPDAELWLLPWAALPVSENEFLIERYPITYLISGRDLVSDGRAKLPTTPAVLMANPTFDLTPEKVKAAILAVFKTFKFEETDLSRGMTNRNQLPKVQRLPGTAVEVQSIKPSIEKYTGKIPATYTDEFALESIFKRVHSPKMVVLSTHGFFLPDQETKPTDRWNSSDTRSVGLTVEGKPIENPLLRCGLMLAGCNSGQPSGDDDGVLTGMEIVGVDLSGTELVVLSACETGLGQVHNGEGVAGLRQAFQLAGAEAVVATLWQISDLESARIMNDLFAEIALGRTKADALRTAQLKRISARREKYGAAHPYFWAAFTLTGQ